MARANRWLAFACLIVGAPAVLSAQTGLFLGGGVVLPYGDYADFAKTGYGGIGGLNIGLTGLPIDLRVEALYLFNDHDSTDAGSTALYGGLASATFAFGGGPVGVYAIGGVGYMTHYFNAPSGQTSEGDWGFTWAAGGGVNLDLLFAEVRYMQRGDTKFIPLMVGIRFGG